MYSKDFIVGQQVVHSERIYAVVAIHKAKVLVKDYSSMDRLLVDSIDVTRVKTPTYELGHLAVIDGESCEVTGIRRLVGGETSGSYSTFLMLDAYEYQVEGPFGEWLTEDEIFRGATTA